MLCNQILNNEYPVIHPDENSERALVLMDDFGVNVIAVVSEEKYVGLLSREVIEHLDEDVVIAKLSMQLNPVLVRPQDHILSALRLFGEASLDLIPVVNEEKIFEGVITPKALLNALSEFYGLKDFIGGLIVLEMPRTKFSLSELTRICEMNECSIMQLNTYTEPTTGLFIVTIRTNKKEISNVVATLQRYEYAVRYYFGEESYNNELKENYDALMHYLNI